MSDGFEYKPLDPDCIRLLHVLPESTPDDIRCQLIDYSPDLSKRNHFAALSYCWGDPTPVATITIDEQPFGVAQNLFDFLQNRFLHGEHELSHDPESPLSSRGLWVDAICINQSDNEEKSFQVQNMWRVYSCADLVIAWLGKEKYFTASAFRKLWTVFDVMKSLEIPPEYVIIPEHEEAMLRLGFMSIRDDFYKGKLSDMLLLSEETYFSRMWVVQEVVWSYTHLVLHSGPHVVPFRSLGYFESSTRNRSGWLKHYVSCLLRAIEPLQSTTTTSVFQKLSKTLFDQSSKHCSDRRDKVFALRSLPDAQLLESECSISPFVVDYSMSIYETAVATLANFSKLGESLGVTHSSGFSKFVAKYAVGAALGVDFDTEEFRTWLMGKMYQDGEQDILDMVTDSGKRIDCQCSAVRDILKGSRPTMTERIDKDLRERQEVMRRTQRRN